MLKIKNKYSSLMMSEPISKNNNFFPNNFSKCSFVKDESNTEHKDKVSSFKISHMYELKKFDVSSSDRIKRYLSSNRKKCLKNIKDKRFYFNYVMKRIPILKWLPNYNVKSYLLNDCIAGLTVGIMNIPQVN